MSCIRESAISVAVISHGKQYEFLFHENPMNDENPFCWTHQSLLARKTIFPREPSISGGVTYHHVILLLIMMALSICLIPHSLYIPSNLETIYIIASETIVSSKHYISRGLLRLQVSFTSSSSSSKNYLICWVFNIICIMTKSSGSKVSLTVNHFNVLGFRLIRLK